MAATSVQDVPPVAPPGEGPIMQQQTEGMMSGIDRPVLIKKKKKKVVQERTSLFERPVVGAPVQIRTGLKENYEPQRSGRENWWRSTVQETPIPGSYESQSADSFLLDLANKPKTYSFKTDGRRLEVNTLNKGAYLLPGRYSFPDLVNELSKKKITYSFKNTSRNDRDMMTFGVQDQDIDVSPCQYENQKNLAIHAEKGVKTAQFKSAIKRFPTQYFKPRDGPGPGDYEYSAPHAHHAIRSSFSSTTARFKMSHTKVPGPGTYTSSVQQPSRKAMEQMGRQHGLFFTCSFQP